MVFAGRKIALALFTLWGVATLVFFLFTIVPGDSAQMMLGKREDPEALAAVRAKYGLDKPVAVQYVNYLGRILPFDTSDGFSFSAPDLGESFQRQGQSVRGLIAATFPNTALLAATSIGFAVLLGMFLGAIAAYHEGSWIRSCADDFEFFGYEFAVFLYGSVTRMGFRLLIRSVDGTQLNRFIV